MSRDKSELEYWGQLRENPFLLTIGVAGFFGLTGPLIGWAVGSFFLFAYIVLLTGWDISTFFATSLLGLLFAHVVGFIPAALCGVYVGIRTALTGWVNWIETTIAALLVTPIADYFLFKLVVSEPGIEQQQAKPHLALYGISVASALICHWYLMQVDVINRAKVTS